MRLATAVLLVLVACAEGSGATVSLLDGKTITGAGLAIAADGASCSLADQRVALADCDWLDFGSGVSAPQHLADSALVVVLADGGWLPATAITAAGRDLVEVQTPWGGLRLELGQILGWGRHSWLDGLAAGKADRVLTANEDLTGMARGITEGKLAFAPDFAKDKPISLDFTQILGLRLGLPATVPKGLVLTVRVADDAPAVTLLPGPRLRLAAAPKVELPTPPAQRLMVVGGRRIFLGSLKPDAVVEEGAFGVTWPHRIDSDLDGNPIRLGGQRYDRGLTVHSRCRLSWQLASGYVRFHAVVGLADLVGKEGDCIVILTADGKEIWRKDRVRGGDAPETLDRDLGGVQRLELFVDYGQRYDIGDHVVLADAWLAKK